MSNYEQDITAMASEEQDGLMRDNVESWIPNTTIWHFARVDEIVTLLDRDALGCWYVLAEATPPQAIALIVTLHADYWAVLADETSPLAERPSELGIRLQFAGLLEKIKERGGKPLWTSDEVI